MSRPRTRYRRRVAHSLRRPPKPLRWPLEGVCAPYGWVATPGFWHVRRVADDPLATLCGQDLRDGLTGHEPRDGEAVCRRCAKGAGSVA